MRIAIYGGTFDPIHNAHLILAEYVREELNLDKIIFIPSALPPHKNASQITDPEKRLYMVKLAINDNPYFEASRVEIEKRDISYTIETVKIIHEKYNLSREDYYLLIGADSLIDLPGWRQPEELFRYCQVVVLPRPDIDIQKAEARFRKQSLFVKTPLLDISSTNIRERVRKGLSIKYLVPPSVENYILTNALYR